MHGGFSQMPIANRAPIVPASFQSGPAWCVLTVWSGQEAEVAKECGVPVYFPVEKRNAVRRGRRVKIDRPLLPGYVFVQFDREDPHQRAHLEGLRGSLGVLCNLDIPMRVPDAVIERLKIAEGAGMFDYTGVSPFAPGESVEIVDGPFAGWIAKIKSASPRKRARLLMGALGEVEIDAEFLRKLQTGVA